MLEQDYERVAAAVRAADSVCIITHLRPDADAVGSACALNMALQQFDKPTRVVIGQRREISRNLLSIPGSEAVELVEDLPDGYDLYVTVDCGSLDRTGLLAPAVEQQAAAGRVVCIDHHASNPGFGSVNLVDYECESTTVALTQILDLLDVQMDKDIAHALYAGLVTDTGSFRWGRPAMHEYAARLMHYGLDTKQIAVDLLDSTTATDLQMLGRVLSGVQVVEAGSHKLGVLVGRLADIGDHSDAAVESLVEFVRALDGTDIGVVFKEQAPGVFATSLRSSAVDCSAIALQFGGGGHVPAAGYTAHGTPEEITEKLVEVVRTY